MPTSEVEKLIEEFARLADTSTFDGGFQGSYYLHMTGKSSDWLRTRITALLEGVVGGIVETPITCIKCKGVAGMTEHHPACSERRRAISIIKSKYKV